MDCKKDSNIERIAEVLTNDLNNLKNHIFFTYMSTNLISDQSIWLLLFFRNYFSLP